MPTEQSATAALHEALSGIDTTAYYAKPDMLGPLHKKVCAVVDELKITGSSPEHIIVVIKGIASEANIGLAGTRLVDQMVKWCIEQYFEEV